MICLRRIAANIIFDRFFLSYNIYLPESEKVLLKNANFFKKFSFVLVTWHLCYPCQVRNEKEIVVIPDPVPKEKIHLFIGASPLRKKFRDFFD